jgi:hypothetical protein
VRLEHDGQAGGAFAGRKRKRAERALGNPAVAGPQAELPGSLRLSVSVKR